MARPTGRPSPPSFIYGGRGHPKAHQLFSRVRCPPPSFTPLIILIHLQSIYNLWSIHAILLSFLDVLQSFYSNFISFLGTNLLTQCQLLFFACFLHLRKSISNGVQIQRNSWRIFLGQKKVGGPRKQLGAARGEQHPPGHARRPRHALVGAAHLECPRTASLPYKIPNIPKPFRVALDQKFCRRKASISTRSNLDPVLAPCQRGESSPVAIFIIPAATTMRRE